MNTATSGTSGISLDEHLVLLGEAATLGPRRFGKSIHKATFYRWARHGALAKDGTRVRLETIKLGGGTYTSKQAIERFMARLSREPGQAATSPVCDLQARHRDLEQIEAELDRMGV